MDDPRHENSSPGSISEGYDRELVKRAIAKRAAGGKLSRDERSALRKFEQSREETDRQRYYRTVPKKHYVDMSGRQHRVLIDQAARYGLPLEGKTVDLYLVLRWFHDFLGQHGPKILRTEGVDPLLAGGEDHSPALEKLREEKYKQARLERLQMERELLPRQHVHDGLARLAGRLRTAGEQLQRMFGAEALDVLHEALDDYERELEGLFAERDLYGDGAEELNRGDAETQRGEDQAK